MSIDYSAVLGVGSSYDDIAMEDLTEQGVRELKQFALQNSNFAKADEFDTEAEWLACVFDEMKYNFLIEYLGMDAQTGYDCDWDNIGYSIDIDVENMKDVVSEATKRFERYINIPTNVFHGVLVW